MNIVVQKFGGTSVATKESREKVASIILNAKNEGLMPVVVVSAMGRKGASYATDTLIGLIKDEDGDCSLRDMDLLMSCGETIASIMISSILRKRGLNSIALTGAQAGIVTDENFSKAEVVSVDTGNILNLLEQDIIPVVTGFQGITENGEITTLGRGGSDTTASVLGEALGARFIEIYTDVDGIMTADPKLVPQARVIPKMSYNEVFQMAELGAKVIHPKSVQAAMRSNIPLVIKNTFTESSGTYITNCQYSLGARIKDAYITGLAHIPNRTQVFIRDSKVEDTVLFDTIAENGISIDLINIFDDRKVFTVTDTDTQKLEDILNNMDVKYDTLPNCTKVTVIGDRMRGVPGMMSRIIKALSKEKIEVLQTADSHTTISCLIKGEDTAKAVSAIHDEFKLNAQI